MGRPKESLPIGDTTMLGRTVDTLLRCTYPVVVVARDRLQDLPPIEELFDPNSPEYMKDPIPQCLALAKRGRLVWYEPWQAWIMTRMDDIMACWK